MAINFLIVLMFAFIAMFSNHPMVSGLVNGSIIMMMVFGVLFFFGTCVGILRFPDFFTRLHAAGKGDTLSTILMLLAASFFIISSAHHLDKTTILSALKILLIINFIFIGSPTATHALSDAGNEADDVTHWKKGDAS